MHRLLYIGILFELAACTPKHPKPLPGDLLFQVGRSSAMNEAIAEATDNNNELTFTHVAIFFEEGGSDSVLEATSPGGVRITPLQEFLDRAERVKGRPGVVVMRLRDTAGLARSVKRAKEYLGLPYDFSYRPDNGRLYCSELVWESYRDTCGRRIFPARPMNFRAADGAMPAFWTEHFEKLGEPIPEGVPGTNPNDMAREGILTEVGRYF